LAFVSQRQRYPLHSNLNDAKMILRFKQSAAAARTRTFAIAIGKPAPFWQVIIPLWYRLCRSIPDQWQHRYRHRQLQRREVWWIGPCHAGNKYIRAYIFDSECDPGEVSCFLGGWACQRNLSSFSMTDRTPLSSARLRIKEAMAEKPIASSPYDCKCEYHRMILQRK